LTDFIYKKQIRADGGGAEGLDCRTGCGEAEGTRKQTLFVVNVEMAEV
jgi:hypothetical protein